MNNPKKRILLITRNLPPLVGGMENLLLHLANTMCTQYSLTVVGPKGCSDYLDKSIEVREVSSALARFMMLAPLVAFAGFYRKRFDLVFGGSGLAAPVCLLLGKFFRAKTLCYVHGLDIVVANRIYQSVFVPCLRRQDSIIVNSRNTGRLCVEAGIGPEKIAIIHPGCHIPTTVDRTAARTFLRLKYDVETDFCLLFVGRVAPRKGLLAFMQNGFEPLLRRRPNTVLIIAGDSPDDSLAHRGDELVKMLEEVEKHNWADRVRFLGKVNNDTLSMCYAGSDCLLLPLVIVDGDVEGFGMVAIEAAAHGTPTVAFAAGGVSDAICERISGHLILPGDYDAMIDAMLTIDNGGDTVSNCRSHARKFGWDVFGTKLLSKLDEVMRG